MRPNWCILSDATLRPLRVKTGAGVRRSLNQIKAANVGSISHSANIVEQITGVNPTHESSFTDLVEEVSTLGIPHLRQQKIQEEFDNTALSKLLEGQTSTREKARLLSPSLLNQDIG